MMKKIFVIIIGLVAIGVGVFALITAQGLSKRCTAQALGTVVDMKIEESTQDNDGVMTTSYTYYPVIEYQAGQKTVAQQSRTGSGSPKYKINDKVAILYNPDNVEEYIIKGDNTADIVGIVFIVAGIAISVVGSLKRF